MGTKLSPCTLRSVHANHTLQVHTVYMKEVSVLLRKYNAHVAYFCVFNFIVKKKNFSPA